jgi:hypothetical protein
MNERAPGQEVHVSASRPDRALGRVVQKFLRSAGLPLVDAGGGEDGAALPLSAADAALGRARQLVLIVTEETPQAWLEAEIAAAARLTAVSPGLEVVALVRGDARLPPGLPVVGLPPDATTLQQGDLRELVHNLREGLAAPATALALRRNDGPYPGLRPFEARDAAWFFGRDAEIAEAAARLGEVGGSFRRWLEIEGGPGAGKSSLALAGLVPVFQRGAIAGAPGEWAVAACRPGRHPVGHLALALTRAFGGLLWYGEVLEALRSEGGLVDLVREHLPADRGLLVVLDDIDDAIDGEVDDRPGYDVLDRRLAEALADFDRRFFLISTVRGDARARVHALLPRLAAAAPDAGARLQLGAMSRTGLAQAIAGPCRLLDRPWPEALRDRILLDAAEAGVSLPALAHLLRALWRSDKGSSIATYESLGGVTGALDAAADGVLAAMDDDERERAWRLLISLVRPGRGARDRTRAVGVGEALTTAGGGPRAQRLFTRLLEDGTLPLLLVERGERPEGPTDPPPTPSPDEPKEWVRLAHDALLLHWSALRRRVDAERGALERRDDVERAARTWLSAGSPMEALPAGRQLAHFEGDDLPPETQAQLPALLGATARHFVEAARRAEDRRNEVARAEREAAEVAERARAGQEAARREAWRRRMRATAAGLGVALVAALAWSVNLVQEQSELHAQLTAANHMSRRWQTQVESMESERHEAERQLLESQQLVRATERQRRVADRAGVRAEMNADEVLRIAGRIADAADDLFARIPGESGKFARQAFAGGVIEELDRALKGAPDNELLRAALARQRQRVAAIAIDRREVGTALAQYEKAIPILESLAEGDEVPHLRSLADAYDWLGRFRARDRTNPQWQDPKAALEWFEKERLVTERLQALEPDVDEHPRRLVELLQRMAEVRVAVDDVAGARIDLERAVDVQRGLSKRRDGEPEHARRLAGLIERQGDLESSDRRYDNARRFYDDARDRAKAVGDEGISRRLGRKLKGLP